MPTASRAPFLSAIVCTRDRAEHLRHALESLCPQTLGRDAFEVVVVDDGSTDATREVALSFSSRLPVRYSFQRDAGLPSARNHGVFMSRGEVLLFLDDDAVADPRLLEVHAEAHRRFPELEVGVLGSTRLAPALAGDPVMRFVADTWGFPIAYAGLEGGEALDFTYFAGGGTSCKRSLLLARGVFNPALRLGCDDVELGFRLSKRGFNVVYDPRAVSTIVRRVGFDELCRRFEGEGKASFVVGSLHDDEVLRRWTEVREAGESWRRFGPAYDLLLRSARELDRLVRLRLEARFVIDPADTALLHRSYSAAFRASKVKGIVEQAVEMGADLVGDTPPPVQSIRQRSNVSSTVRPHAQGR
jgi:glycosyltransferase involved in cell wall biosynthesis